MKVMISQPRYLPFIPYLRRINEADIFIIYDNVQRVKRGFENRNKVVDTLSNKEHWLTIPILSSSKELIKDTKINTSFVNDHLNKLYNYYPKGDKDFLQLYYRHINSYGDKSNYTDVLELLLRRACNYYGIQTKIVRSSEISDNTNGGIKELMELTKKVGGDTYISGPTCLDYGLSKKMCKEEYNINLEIDNYSLLDTMSCIRPEYINLSFIHFELMLGKSFIKAAIHHNQL